MYDLIIIGGGPAGLAAAIYAIRKRLEVLPAKKLSVALPTRSAIWTSPAF